MKKILGLAIIGFSIALAVTVAYRMSAEAMAVVIGVVFGVLASIPMSVLILFITQRQRRQEEESRWSQGRNAPPVVVIQGGSMLQRPEWPTVGLPAPLGVPTASTVTSMASASPRQFKVIGEDWVTNERV